MNEFVEYTARKNAIKEGLEEGVFETQTEHIKNMFKEGLDIDMIARITNKTEEEIIKMKESL